MNRYSICVFAPHWIGDLVMAHSLLQAIKQRYPDATVDLFAPAHCAAVARFMPEVSSTHILPFRHGGLHIRQRLLLARFLRSRQYDIAFILPNSFKSALVAWLAGIRIRVGWLGEWRFGLLTHTKRLKADLLPLQASRYQGLIALLDAPVEVAYHSHYTTPLIPKLSVPTSQCRAVWERFALPNMPLIALCPVAAFGQAKCWPPRHFAALADRLCARGLGVVLLGDDASTANQIYNLCRHKQQLWVLAGKTTLAEAIYLLTQMTLTVCNDSGLMHIAAAVDVPLVAIYGPTSAFYAPPLSTKATVLVNDIACRPCYQRVCPLGHHKCMVDIVPETVEQAIVDLLSVGASQQSVPNKLF